MTELNRNDISVYQNYVYYRKVPLWKMIVCTEVRELFNDVKKKNEEMEEYYRQVKERKNKYPHLFKDSH